MGACFTLGASLALGANFTLKALLASLARRPLWSRLALLALGASFTLRARNTLNPLLTLGARGASRADGTEQSLSHQPSGRVHLHGDFDAVLSDAG